MWVVPGRPIEFWNGPTPELYVETKMSMKADTSRRGRIRARWALSVGLFTLWSGPALASGWSDFENVFANLPCSDGWAACQVDGESVGASGVKDGAGRLHPADMRFGFWDFEA